MSGRYDAVAALDEAAGRVRARRRAEDALVAAATAELAELLAVDELTFELLGYELDALLEHRIAELAILGTARARQ